MNVLIKFSGEYFTAKDELTREGILFLNHIKNLNMKSGYIVVGGGNRVRGKNSKMNRNSSDRLGIISTILNAFILKEYLEMIGVESVVFSHFNDFGKKYSAELAINSFNSNKWVILAGGLGNVGYISTDLNAVIKSLELNVDALIKVTHVDGVYDNAPELEGSEILKKVSHSDVIQKNLAVMDLSAVAIANENNLSIGVCSVVNFAKFMNGEDFGSIIGYDWRK